MKLEKGFEFCMTSFYNENARHPCKIRLSCRRTIKELPNIMGANNVLSISRGLDAINLATSAIIPLFHFYFK